MASNNLSFEVSAFDRTAKALDKIATRLDRLAEKLDKVDRQRVKVKVDVDTDGALAKLNAFASRASKKVNKLSDDLVSRAGLIRAAVVGALAALPLAAQVAAAGVVLHMGAAFATIGIVAAAHTKKVREAFKSMATRVAAEAQFISKPFVKALTTIANIAYKTFGSFTPALRSAFAQMAPAVTSFVRSFAEALKQLIPALGPITEGFSRFIVALGQRLIPVFAQISVSLQRMSVVVSNNAVAFADLIGWILQIIPVALNVVTAIAKWGAAHQTLTKALLIAPVAFAGFILAVAVVDKAVKALALTTAATSSVIKAFQIVVFNARVALALMGVSATGAKLALGGIGAALALAGAAVAFFVHKNKEAKQAADDFAHTLDSTTGALTAQSREFVFNELKSRGATEAAQQFGVSQKTLVNAVLGNKDAMKSVNRAIAEHDRAVNASKDGLGQLASFTGQATGESTKFRAAVKSVAKAVREGRRQHELARAAQVNDAIASSGLSDAQKKLARQQAKVNLSAEKQAQALQLVIDKMTKASEETLALSDAQIAYHQAIDEATKTIRKNGKTLDLSTRKGRENQQALNGIVAATNRQIDAAARAGKSQRRLDAIQARGAVAWAKSARAAGMSTRAVNRWIKKLFEVPSLRVARLRVAKARGEKDLNYWKRQLKDKNLTKTRRAKVEAKIQQALNRINRVKARLASIKHKNVYVNVITRRRNAGGHPHVTKFYPDARGGLVGRSRSDGRVMRFARGGMAENGGQARGPGGPMDDKIPTLLSNGEFVIRERVVRRLGVGFFNALNRMNLGGLVQRFAVGGRVKPVSNVSSGSTGGVIPVMTGVGDGMSGKGPDAVKAAKDVADRVLKVYKDSDGMLKKDGRGIVEGLSAGIKSRQPHAVKSGRNVEQGIRKVYKPAQKWLKPPGRSMVGGLTSGMRSAMPAAHKATTNGVNGVLQRWGKLRNTRGTARFVVNSVMAVLVRRFNSVAKSFGAKTASVPHFRDGGFVKPRRLAEGGQVKGPGGPRDDKIPAMLSNGEFVVNAKATRANLGLLKALNKYQRKPKGDPIPEFPGAPHLKDGGLISDQMFFNPMKWYRNHTQGAMSKLSRFTSNTFDRAMAKAPKPLLAAALKKIKKLYEMFGVGSAAAGVRFAQRQEGKPYIWGGVGPRGYDCSGIWSAVTRVIQGFRNPHRRMFSTASFGNPAGYRRGARSNVVVGVNPGSHMAGTIDLGRRFNIEAGGTAGGVGVNGRAGGAYTRRWAGRWGLTRGGVRREFGGPLNAGQWAMVGERGPEMIRLRHPGRVFSNPQSQRLMSPARGGGDVYNVNVTVDPTKMSPDAAAIYMEKTLAAYKRRTGKRQLAFEGER